MAPDACGRAQLIHLTTGLLTPLGVRAKLQAEGMIVTSSIKVVRTVAALRKATAKWRENAKSIALVPTMGALHVGHLSLVKLARKKSDKVVVSIFVNPTQFAPTEDLSRYPRDEEGDLAKLEDAGAHLVWMPDNGEMYPEGSSTTVQPGSAAQDLEGAFRPSHFGGVVTVCCKLFNQVGPDVAIFGEKDYQQLAVLRQMVCDLNMPLKLIAAKTVREEDGLALSSRNAYLSAEERKIAPLLHTTLSDVAREIAQGADRSAALDAAISKVLAGGFKKVDYIELRDAATLAVPDADATGPLRVLAAVWLGKTRLIDNVPV